MDNLKQMQATSLQPFLFNGTTEVQAILINGEPYFVAVDACSILGLQNVTERIKNSLDADEYLPYVVHRSGQQRTVNVVNESGLYALIFQSRKIIAKSFRKWVTNEVLPSIRKTGTYSNAKLPHPANFTDCILLSCNDGVRERQMCLYYNYSDGWHNGEWETDVANIIQGGLKQIGLQDKNIIESKTEWYSIRNGKFESSGLKFPSAKREQYIDPISICERAIRDYHKAKNELHEAAKNVYEGIN